MNLPHNINQTWVEAFKLGYIYPGLSHAEIAEEMGVHRMTIYRWLTKLGELCPGAKEIMDAFNERIPDLQDMRRLSDIDIATHGIFGDKGQLDSIVYKF